MSYKTYNSVQEMLDDISDPEFSEAFRSCQRRWSVRLRRAILLWTLRLKLWLERIRK